MALSAADRQPKQRAGRNLNRVCDDGILCGIGIIVPAARAVRCHPQESGGREEFNLFGRKILLGRRDKFVTGKLLADEDVKRLVRIEAPHDVIAIPPGILSHRVGVVISLGVGIPGHVEPVPPPSLAVVRTCQQPVHKPLVRIWTFVGLKRLNFLARRWQPREIERHAANQRPLLDLGGERESGRLKLGEQKRIDRASNTIRVQD